MSRLGASPVGRPAAAKRSPNWGTTADRESSTSVPRSVTATILSTVGSAYTADKEPQQATNGSDGCEPSSRLLGRAAPAGRRRFDLGLSHRMASCHFRDLWRSPSRGSPTRSSKSQPFCVGERLRPTPAWPTCESNAHTFVFDESAGTATSQTSATAAIGVRSIPVRDRLGGTPAVTLDGARRTRALVQAGRARRGLGRRQSRPRPAPPRPRHAYGSAASSPTSIPPGRRRTPTSNGI